MKASSHVHALVRIQRVFPLYASVERERRAIASLSRAKTEADRGKVNKLSPLLL